MKKIYYLSFIILFASLATVKAQNLVPNSSFEIQDTCPDVSQIELAHPWNTPTSGTPDLFNSTCSTQNGPGRTGIGSAGIYCYSFFPDSREYLQCRLTKTLTAGQNYNVVFYVQRVDFQLSVSTIGAYFSADSVYMDFYTDPLDYTPQVESPSEDQITSSSSWTAISGSFIASGNERYIIIGNFHDDAHTTTSVVNASSQYVVGYYNIDDVSVTAGSAGVEDVNQNNTLRTYPNPASNNLVVEYASLNKPTVEVFDLLSRQVSVPAVCENTRATLNTSKLTPGTYFVTVKAANGFTSTSRVTISR